MYSNVQVTEPAVEPVSIADAKAQLRLEPAYTKDDIFINGLIKDARDYAEEITGLSLINRNWKYTTDNFPGAGVEEEWWDGVREGAMSATFGKSLPIRLPHGPVSAVVSLTYYDRDDTAHVLSGSLYRLNGPAERILPKTGTSWPSNVRSGDAVEVVYTAGYGAAPINVPQGIRRAILFLIAHWYENREIILQGNAAVTMLVGEVPQTATEILSKYRRMRL